MSFAHYSTPIGQSGLEVRLRAMQEDLRKLKVCESSTIKVEQTTRGQVLTAIDRRGHGGGIASFVRQFRLKSVANDHLVCRTFDGTTEGDSDILIAKPFDLRRTGWHGVTVTYALESVLGTSASVTYDYQTAVYRIATSGSVVEHQGIRPFYVADRSIIFATQPDNGAGVAGIEWIDLNADGRAWAKIA